MPGQKPAKEHTKDQPSSLRFPLWALVLVVAVVGVAFSFWPSDDSAGSSASEGSSAPEFTPTSNDSQQQRNPTSEWKQLRGYRIAGKEFSTSQATMQECQTRCLESSKCAAFSWDGKCSLKTDTIPLEAARGTTSGFKHITPSRVRSPPLFEMWGSAVWQDLEENRRTTLSAAITGVIQTMIKYQEASLKSLIPQELKKAFTEHLTILATLQEGAGPAERAELMLLQAYIHMFQMNTKKGLSALGKVESAGAESQRAAAIAAKSFVLEFQEQSEAETLRASLLNMQHVFNHSYDDYLRLHLVGYAKGRTGPKEYGSTLLKLFAFRRFWAHEIQASGPGKTAWLKHFPPSENVTQGIPGFYLAGGGDLEELKKAQRFLFLNDFVVLRELVTPWEVKMLVSYYKACLKPYYENHDSHLGRTSAYNDRVNYHLNSDLRPLMEQVFGFQVQVAYSFMCHYEFYSNDPGAPELKPHTDRQDNEWTVSMQLYSEPKGVHWPIMVDKELTLPPESSWRTTPSDKSRIVKAVMPPGDAILFMGRIHTHWRPPMGKNLKEFGSILFHYVSTQFDRLKWNKHRGKSEPYD